MKELIEKINAEFANEDEKTIFYTALYHSLIVPNLITDVDGKYRGWWTLLEKLPEGWQLDNSSGSPITGYKFAINGSPLKAGFKRALVKCLHDLNNLK